MKKYISKLIMVLSILTFGIVIVINLQTNNKYEDISSFDQNVKEKVIKKEKNIKKINSDKKNEKLNTPKFKEINPRKISKEKFIDIILKSSNNRHSSKIMMVALKFRKDKNIIAEELLSILRKNAKNDLKDPIINVREIIYILSFIEYKPLIPFLIDIAKDESLDSSLRSQSAYLLGSMKSNNNLNSIRKIIRELVLDKQSSVGDAASLSCKRLKDIKCIPFIEKLLKKYPAQSTDARYLRRIIFYLKKLNKE